MPILPHVCTDSCVHPSSLLFYPSAVPPSYVQVMEAEVWHIDEYRRALEDRESCTPAEMAGHFDKILSRMRVDVMAHGNVARQEAEGLVDSIAAALGRPEPLPESELPTRHAISLPAKGGSAGSGVVVVDLQAETEEEKNSAVQVGSLFVCGLLLLLMYFFLCLVVCVVSALHGAS